MVFTNADIIKGIILLGSIAHLMLYFNGLWNDALWLSAILTVSIPALIYKFTLKTKSKKHKVRSKPENFI